MPRSKKVDDKKKSLVKPTQTKENKKSLDKKVKPMQTKENKKPSQAKSPDKKPTQTKKLKEKPENSEELPDKKPTQTKENKKPKEKSKDSEPLQTKETEKSEILLQELPDKKVIPKEKSVRKRSNSLELFDKYAYDIYTEDEKRHEALGNLVIAFGPTELIKKLDSENMKTPNMSHKFNYDKKWVRDNFKSEKR